MINQHRGNLYRGFSGRVKIMIVRQRKHKTGAAFAAVGTRTVQIANGIAEAIGGSNKGFFVAVGADDAHDTLLKVVMIITKH